MTQIDASERAALLPRIAMPRLAPAELQALGLRDMMSVGETVAGFLF